jgi:hypothetical protein
LLPPEVRAAYDLDELLVADFDGQLRWTIQQGSDLAFGPFLGAVFADAVLPVWLSRPYDPGTVYTNPEVWA